MSDFKFGDLIASTETNRVGVVLEVSRGTDCFIYHVKCFDGDDSWWHELEVCHPSFLSENQPKTLRDEFAAAWLTGHVANPQEMGFTDLAQAAKYAYRVADAMLKARNL